MMFLLLLTIFVTWPTSQFSMGGLQALLAPEEKENTYPKSVTWDMFQVSIGLNVCADVEEN